MYVNQLCSIFIILVSISTIADSTKCVSFNNITLKVVDKHDKEMNITSFSGVLERRNLDNISVSIVYVRNQDVQDIGAECVRHLIHLRTLTFWGCQIKTISPGAFRNIPALKNLQISVGNLTKIPAGVFEAIPSIQILRLHDNAVYSIEEKAFANLPNLKRLHMDNNKLKVWDNYWFFNTTNIEIMDFQNNQIEVIPSRAFQYLNKLKQLYFDSNEIKTIEADSFTSVKHLDYLGLRYNRLKELSEDVFPNKISVRSLLIDGNYLNYLSNELLKKLSVKDLTLDGNPWKCPCLDRIHYWVFTKNITLRTSVYCNDPNIPLCFYPLSYSTTCLEYNDEEMSKRYIETLRKMKTEVNEHCARLD